MLGWHLEHMRTPFSINLLMTDLDYYLIIKNIEMHREARTGVQSTLSYD